MLKKEVEHFAHRIGSHSVIGRNVLHTLGVLGPFGIVASAEEGKGMKIN